MKKENKFWILSFISLMCEFLISDNSFFILIPIIIAVLFGFCAEYHSNKCRLYE